MTFVITGAAQGIGAATARMAAARGANVVVADIAHLVCFLASAEAAYVNGAVWLIDGGALAWRGTTDALK